MDVCKEVMDCVHAHNPSQAILALSLFISSRHEIAIFNSYVRRYHSFLLQCIQMITVSCDVGMVNSPNFTGEFDTPHKIHQWNGRGWGHFHNETKSTGAKVVIAAVCVAGAAAPLLFLTKCLYSRFAEVNSPTNPATCPTITNIKNELTDLCGNSLPQNY